MRKSYVGRRHVSWNEDSARKDYEVPEPSAPTRSPVEKTTTYQVARSCGVPKLRSLHQAPLTPPHHALRSVLRRNRFSAFGESCRLFPFRCLHAPRPPPTLRDPTPEHGFRTSQPAVPGHHPPPLRSPDDRLVVALFDLPCCAVRRLTDKSVRLLDVT